MSPFEIGILIGLIAGVPIGVYVGVLVDRAEWKRRIEKWGE